MRHVRSQASSEARAIRARAEALDDAIDRMNPRRPIAAARRLVRVYDGGAIPTAAGLVYLTHPCELDGDEVEGGAATVNVDTTITLPVVVLGVAAVAGDVLTAYAVGGRWVSEAGSSGGSGIPCGSCTIPRGNLTLSWVNLIYGNGSTTLVYNATPTTWSAGCTNQLLYQLSCVSGQVELRVTYFLSGSCPTGQSQYASNLRSNPYRLILNSLTCGGSFLMDLSVTSTSNPNLSAFGYTGFIVSH